MLPAVADVCGMMVDIEVAVTPVGSASPVIAPTPDRPTRAEGKTRRNYAGADIGRIAKVIRGYAAYGQAP